MAYITAEMFEKATGYPPIDDDLERCNCPHAGEFLHSFCGWNESRNLPQYSVGPRHITKTEKS